MSWLSLKPELLKIAEFSNLVHRVSHDNIALFDYLDDLPNQTKKELRDSYHEGSGPISSIRKKVSEQILVGKVNRSAIESDFKASKKKDPKAYTPYKNLFSVLYPFVIHTINDTVYQSLQSLAELIRKDLNIESAADIKCYGFDGTRNTGDEHAWFAIYNKSHPNQRRAKQLFFSIGDGKVVCALYDRIAETISPQLEINLETDGYDHILNFYEGQKEKILSDNYRAWMLEKYPIEDLIRKLESNSIRTWLIKPGEKGSMWKLALKQGNIRIGWAKVIDDIVNGNNYDDEFILDRLRKHYPREDEDRRQTNNKLSIVSFMNEVKVGDIVLAVSGISQIIGIGIIASDMTLDEGNDEFKTMRQVDWLVDLSQKPHEPEKRMPIKTVTEFDNPSAITVLKSVFGPGLLSQTVNKSSMTKNIILYGPPGTGKTYFSIDKAVLLATGNSSDHQSNKKVFDNLRNNGQIEFVTFHQNYSYEDFVVGLRPDLENDGLRFRQHRGIFYEIAKRAKENYLASKQGASITRTFDEAFSEILKPLLERNEPVEVTMSSGLKLKITDVSETTIHFDKPSGGNQHTLSIQTLEDIVNGSRVVTSGLAAYYTPLANLVNENRKAQNGSTKETLRNFVLVIDEINRANISKVFGELITLLEEDKRLDSKNELKISLPNGEKDFAVPPNLYVIGTMNTADKSIALVDIALRRRFEFEGKYPDYKAINNPEASDILKRINAAVFDKKGSADYLIGHAYFMNTNSIEETLKNKVIPLLMEYFMGKTNFVEDIFKNTTWRVIYNKETYQWDINKS